MAIQRQAENPGESLMIGEPFHYSIKPSKKKISTPADRTSPAHSLDTVRTDLLYTFAVFGVILLVLFGIYLKMR